MFPKGPCLKRLSLHEHGGEYLLDQWQLSSGYSMEHVPSPPPDTINLPTAPQGGVGPPEPLPDSCRYVGRPGLVQVSCR